MEIPIMQAIRSILVVIEPEHSESLALKRAKSKATRSVFLLAAVLAFAYIVSVALTRSPYGIFA